MSYHIATRSNGTRRPSRLFTDADQLNTNSSINNVEQYNYKPAFKIIRPNIKSVEDTYAFPEVCPLPMLPDFDIIEEPPVIPITNVSMHNNMRAESPKPLLKTPPMRKRGRSMEIIDNFFKKAKRALTPTRKSRLSNDETKTTINQKICKEEDIIESSKSNPIKEDCSKGRSRPREKSINSRNDKRSKSIDDRVKLISTKFLDTSAFMTNLTDISNNSPVEIVKTECRTSSNNTQPMSVVNVDNKIQSKNGHSDDSKKLFNVNINISSSSESTKIMKNKSKGSSIIIDRPIATNEINGGKYAYKIDKTLDGVRNVKNNTIENIKKTVKSPRNSKYVRKLYEANLNIYGERKITISITP